MTLKEAKEILKKKGYSLHKVENFKDSQAFFFDDKVLKCAVATVNANGYMVISLDECEPIKEDREITMADANRVVDKMLDESPALKESAKQFNDALLDEQAKKIKEQKKQIKRLNKILASRNKEIWDLNEEIKDHILSERNKDEMISGLKKVNEGLRHNLADMTIAKVDEQALKSAESALVYKDDVIDKQEKALKKICEYTEQLEIKIRNITFELTGRIEPRTCYCKYDPFEDFQKFAEKYGI